MNKINNDKIFFVYTRVSKTWEYDTSLDDQKSVILSLAEKNWHKYKLVEEKASRNKDIRAEFDSMMLELINDSKLSLDNRKYWGIYVFKLDRFSRNSEDFVKWELLLDKWYKIISVTETLENTPTWRLLFRMLSSFAIFESEKLWNRQSLSKIQNLIRQNFNWLWWKLIFWYYFNNKWNNDSKELKINKEQALIINKIYNIYLEHKNGEKISENEKYLLIWDKLEQNEKKIIKEYISNNTIDENNAYIKDNTSNDLRFIRNIIENKHNIKYNWNYSYNISINDELIVNYIQNVSLNEEFELEWINDIWWEIQFKFYFPELQIIDDLKYKNTRNETKIYLKRDEIIWRYSDLLYTTSESWEIIEFEAYIQKNSTQYRPKKRGKKDSRKIYISQLKINELLSNNKIFKKIKFTDEQLSYIKELWTNEIKRYFWNEDKKLKIKKTVYQRMLDDYWYKIKYNDTSELNILTKEFDYYNSLLNNINNEINNLNSKIVQKLDIFLNIFSNAESILKNIEEKNDQQINNQLKVLIKSIEIDKTKTIKHIELNLFIKELLWMTD